MEKIKNKFIKLSEKYSVCEGMQSISEIKDTNLLYHIRESDKRDKNKFGWFLYLTLYYSVHKILQENEIISFLHNWYFFKESDYLDYCLNNSEYTHELILFIKENIHKVDNIKEEIDYNTLL